MVLYSSIVLSKLCPTEDAQTKVDGGGIQCINISICFDLKIITVTTSAGISYEKTTHN